MSRALWLLLRLRALGAAREMGRVLRHPAKALILLFVALYVGTLAAGGYFLALPVSGELLVFLLAAFYLFFFLYTSYDTGTPGSIRPTLQEIEFLFSGPVARRGFIAYKHVVEVFWIAVASAGIALFVHGGLNGVAIAFLVSLMIGLIAVSVATATAHLIGVSKRIFSRLPQILWCGVLAVGVFWVIEVIASVSRQDLEALFAHENAEPLVTALRETSFAAVALVPFAPVQMMVASTTCGEFLLAAFAGLAVYAAFFSLGLAINWDFRREAAWRTDRLTDAREKLRHGQMATLGAKETPRKKSPAPFFPFWGGFGPIAWSQTILFLRTGRRGLGVFLLITAILATLVHLMFPEILMEMPRLFAVWFAVIIFIGTSAEANVRDSAFPDFLKLLPVRPVAIVSGKIVPWVTGGWLVQLIGLALIGGILRELTLALWIGAFFLPLNLLCATTGFSLRSTFPGLFGQTTSDHAIGSLLVFLVALFVITCASVIAGSIALLAVLLLEASALPAMTIGWITVFAIALLSLVVASLCFRDLRLN